MKVKISQIAELINADIDGNPDEVITHPDKIETAEAGSITFFSNPKYEKFLYTTRATAVLLDKNFHLSQPVPATLLRVENVYLALSTLFSFFDKSRVGPSGISPLASVDADATIGDGVSIGPFAVVEAGAHIGRNTHIGPQVYIGTDVLIGEGCRIYPGVRIYHDCMIRNGVVIHANSVIGSDGFGFAVDERGEYAKIPQIGHVEVGDRVEIGANSVIDRASMGRTVLEEGVKLDNLIQVGHNVVIGKNSVLAAQTGVAGSARIGQNVQVGGQAGIAGHLQIGDNVRLGGQTGIISDLDGDENYFGTPAMQINDFMRSYAVFRQLPQLRKEVHRLKKQLDELNKRE